MTLENVLAGAHQFKLPIMLLNLLWKYEAILILKKLNVEVRVITIYKPIYFAPPPYDSLCFAPCVNQKNFHWK